MHDDEVCGRIRTELVREPKRTTTRLVTAWLKDFNVKYGEYSTSLFRLWYLSVVHGSEGSIAGLIYEWRQLDESMVYEIRGTVLPDIIEDMLNIEMRDEIPRIWSRVRGLDHSVSYNLKRNAMPLMPALAWFLRKQDLSLVILQPYSQFHDGSHGCALLR